LTREESKLKYCFGGRSIPKKGRKDEGVPCSWQVEVGEKKGRGEEEEAEENAVVRHLAERRRWSYVVVDILVVDMSRL
jgi:hypothetical protein